VTVNGFSATKKKKKKKETIHKLFVWVSGMIEPCLI